MAQDHNDIYSIVERLRILEEGLTPTNVKHGLNRQQKSVNQLSATFKPKTVAVLTAPKDPKNPMAGKLVGGNESKQSDGTVLEAEMAEDVLEKVKSSFKDFIKQAEEEIKDSDIKEKKKGDSDLKAKDKQDRDLVTKQTEDSELGAALSGTIPAAQPAGEPGVSIKESSPVKTITNECGQWEMHGDQQNGFEIRHSGRSLPTRFKDMDQAEMAIHMFNKRRQQQNDAQDYIEEK
jgi:hypothetical protein